MALHELAATQVYIRYIDVYVLVVHYNRAKCNYTYVIAIKIILKHKIISYNISRVSAFIIYVKCKIKFIFPG